MGSVHVWLISLYLLAVIPVTSVKRACIFPHVLESTKSVTGPLTFSSICNILHIGRALFSADNFHVLDHTPTGFQLKIKEAIDIQREQPSSVNQQLHHVNLKLSF